MSSKRKKKRLLLNDAYVVRASVGVRDSERRIGHCVGRHGRRDEERVVVGERKVVAVRVPEEHCAHSRHCRGRVEQREQAALVRVAPHLLLLVVVGCGRNVRKNVGARLECGS